MAVGTKVELSFSGVNAQAPAHMLPEGFVQTATNLDFSLEAPAATVRRGVVQQISTPYQHYGIFKSYTPNISNSIVYTNYKDNGGTYAIMRGTIGGTFVDVVRGGFNSTQVGYGKYKDWTFLAGAGTAVTSFAYAKDDGTNCTQWILPAPNAPTVTLNTQGTLALGNGTYTIKEGTDGGHTGTATVTADGTTAHVNIDVNGIVGPLNLTTNGGGFTIGNEGVHYVDLAFANPQNVYRISFDCSVNDANYTNYLHAEYLPNLGSNVLSGNPDATAQISGQLYQGTDTTSGLTEAQKAQIVSVINQNFVPIGVSFPTAANVFGAIAFPRTQFSFVGAFDDSTGADPWSLIYAIRVLVENYNASPAQVVQLRSPRIDGDTSHPLNDISQGYTWWQTYGIADSQGNIAEESAPSAPSALLKGQHCNATVVGNHNTTNLTSPRASGVTHLITYRQGGYTQDAYAVGTAAFASPYSATTTSTDSMSDIQAISLNVPMTRDVYQISPNGGGLVDFPGDILTLATRPWYDRMWIADSNRLFWSMPGKPGTFPHTSVTYVGDAGDPIQGIIPFANQLVIVKRDTVYEMQGSVFEGPSADFVIQPSGARRGSIAPATVITTPYGIPLLHYDGIEMYQPGAGVSKPLPWVVEQIGDAFRGFTSGDPAALKGKRVPAINGGLFNASAAYNEGKLYLAVPTGTSVTTANSTIFVLDFNSEKVWWYNPGLVTALEGLFYDFFNNSVLAAGFSGVFEIENNTSDGGAVIISTFVTRAWTTPTDTIVENLAIEYAGGPWTAYAIFDGTNTSTLGTFGSSGAPKQYINLPLNGTLANNIVFGLAGTTTGLASVYGLTFDAFPHPARVNFYQEEPFTNDYQGDKLWDAVTAELSILGTNPLSTLSVLGTVLAKTFVDGVAVMTNTITGTGAPSGAAQLYTWSFPAETYGGVAYTTYTGTNTASGGATFKFWGSKYAARNEPLKVTYWKTDPISGDEVILDGFTADLFVQGTVTATVFADSVALTTATITNTTTTGNPQHRQSYIRTVPMESYARSYWIEYTSPLPFKHYNTHYHTRPEPNRYTTYVSDKRSLPTEHRFDNFWCEINPLGNSVIASMYVDGLIVQASTFTGSLRDRFVASVPPETYGKTAWVSYTVSGTSDVSGGIAPSTGGTAGAVPGVFKWYSDGFNGTAEPDRVLNYQVIKPPYPSEHYLKTWIAELNPLGTCTGTVLIDGVQVFTNTFAGNIREMYNVGIDEDATMTLKTATAVEIRYSAAQAFKHYRTEIESEPKPFGKTTWAITYKKIGGASQIDLARFWAIDVEPSFAAGISGTATITSIWDIDEQPGFSTNTLLVSTRTYIDRIPFPAGGRGRLFQQRIISSAPIKVWRSSLQEEIIGVKGFSVKAYEGSPQESSYDAFKYSG